MSPGVIEDLAEDVWDEIKDDWTAVTDFIESLPPYTSRQQFSKT